MQSLYERLGGSDGIERIAGDVVDRHLNNPKVAPRFADADVAELKKSVAQFFIMGTGGPQVYEGDDMLTAHKHMNISETEFVAVLDDALAALAAQSVGERETQEILFTLYGMKGDIVGV